MSRERLLFALLHICDTCFHITMLTPSVDKNERLPQFAQMSAVRKWSKIFKVRHVIIVPCIWLWVPSCVLSFGGAGERLSAWKRRFLEVDRRRCGRDGNCISCRRVWGGHESEDLFSDHPRSTHHKSRNARTFPGNKSNDSFSSPCSLTTFNYHQHCHTFGFEFQR